MKVIKKDLVVVKSLIWNRTGDHLDIDDEASVCELTFSDGSKITYVCEDVDELENEPKGIYENWK